jgi:hypothetical protein
VPVRRQLASDARCVDVARRAATGSFEQVLFTTIHPAGDADLSDHCPIAVAFESDGAIEPSDAITVLLDRLAAVQAELEDIRAGLAALRE